MRQEVDGLRIGQQVLTDTKRVATVLEISSTYVSALIQFPNGRSSWWPITTLEPMNRDRQAQLGDSTFGSAEEGPAVRVRVSKPASACVSGCSFSALNYWQINSLGQFSRRSSPEGLSGAAVSSTLGDCPIGSTRQPSSLPRNANGAR